MKKGQNRFSNTILPIWARMGEERGVYRVLVGKPEGKRPLGRPRRRWVDIRMDLQEVGCEYMDWIGLAQDRQVADTSGSVKCGEFLDKLQSS